MPVLDPASPPEFTQLTGLPERLGPCRLLERLGAGAMGTVFLAELAVECPYAVAGTRVAVKVLHPERLGRPGAVERFQREALLGMLLAHPAIVRTFDVLAVTSGALTYHALVMEHVEGSTLHDVMADLGAVPEALLRHLGTQIARGLQAVHAAGAVHRDIKPANILITPDDQVKLMDLGLARVLDESVDLTRSGQFVGTLLYAAPEMIQGGEVGPAVDLYAFGVVLYQAATGTQPFHGDNPQQVLWRHIEHVPPRAGSVNPQVSAFFEEVIACLIEKDPEKRFASAALLARVLEEGEASPWWVERERNLRAGRPAATLRPLRVPRPTAFVGREAERLFLEKQWHEARFGRGRVVVLEGELGVGKTRLLDEFVRALGAAGEPAHVLYGAYPPRDSGPARGALTQAVVDHFGEPGLEAELGRYLTVTPRLVPALAALLLGAPPPADAEPLTPERLEAVVCHLARALAAERPLLWLVEDVHFATAEGRGILQALAAITEHQPILLVLTTRPGLPAEDLRAIERLEPVRRMLLPRLGSGDALVLADAALAGEHPARALVERTALRSDGNPFFLLEMARGLGAAGPGRVLASPDVPTSLRELFLARLRDLDDGERALLDVGAVIGYTFDPDLAARALERRRLEVLQSLAAIERRSGVVLATGAGFRFDHHLLHDLLYEALPPALGAEYHARVAHAYAARAGLAGKEPGEIRGEDAVFLARHALRGGLREEGGLLLLRALDHLALRYQNEALLALVDLALAALGDDLPALVCDVRLREADCLDLLARRGAERVAAAAACAAARASGDARRVGRASYRLGRLLYRMSDFDRAAPVLEEALARARETADAEIEGAVLNVLGGMEKSLGHYPAARAHLEHNLTLARSIGDLPGQANASRFLGNIALDFDDYEEARTHFERELALSRASGYRRGEASAVGSLGLIDLHLGRHERALYELERGLSLIRQIGDRQGEATALSNLGAVLHAVGRYDRARAQLLRALVLAREIGFRRGECSVLIDLGTIALEEGRFEEARVRLQAGLELCRSLRLRDIEGEALLACGELERARGDDGGGGARFAEALALERDLGARHGIAVAATALGRECLRTGAREEARSLLVEAEALAAAAAMHVPGALPAAYLALLGDRDPAAVAVAERMPVALRAEAHLVLHQAGGAGEHLAAAQALLARLSAHLGPAERELFQAGNPVARLLRAGATAPS